MNKGGVFVSVTLCWLSDIFLLQKNELLNFLQSYFQIQIIEHFIFLCLFFFFFLLSNLQRLTFIYALLMFKSQFRAHCSSQSASITKS